MITLNEEAKQKLKATFHEIAIPYSNEKGKFVAWGMRPYVDLAEGEAVSFVVHVECKNGEICIT